MKNPFVKTFALAGLAALLVTPFAQATPYATAITNNLTSISFRLNEAADSVKIISLGGTVTNDLGALPAGLQTVGLTIVGPFQVEVNKGPAFGYFQGIANQISTDTNKFVRFNAPRGVAVNRNPASPYFGRIYVSNADTGSVTIAGFPTRAMPQGDGLFLLNADFTDADGQGDVARTAGLNWRNPVVTDQANKPFRVEVGEDNNLYISDYTTPTNAMYTGNLYVTDPDVSPLLATNVFVPDVNNIGRIPSSAIVRGSLGAANLTVYAVSPDKNYTYDFFGFPATSFSVMQRWDVGAGPLPSAAAPVRVTDLPILIADVPAVLSDIDIAPDGKYFIAQNRSAGNEAGLWVVDPALDADGSGFPDIVFNSYAYSLAYFGATNDLLFQTRAVKVAPDNSVVALVRDDNRVWIIPLTNGLPDLNGRRLMNNGVTTTIGRDISFDAACNLYTVSSGQAALHVFSPGFGSRAVTGSDGTFSITRITNASPLVSIASTDPNLYERMASDTGNFTVTRLGDLSAPLDVVVAYTGTAANGVDYQTLSTTVNIPANSISATTTVTPVDNSALDGPRTIVVTIQPDAAYTVSIPAAVTLQVRDDETPPGPVLFSDDFDTDTSANYTVRFGADNGVDDKLVAFNYDYSADGLPSAPHSAGGTTLGLKVTVNKSDATAAGAAGVNVYPSALNVSNEFALRFDMYLRFGVAAGTTEHALFGVNHSGARTNRALTGGGLIGGDGLWCAVESDGSASSTARSYAIFGSTNAAVAPPFSSASARAFDAFFTTPPFTGVPGGAPSGQWADVELIQTNLSTNSVVVTLKINAVTILSRTNNTAFTSGTIMLGHMDSFASIGSALNSTVFDNVRVIDLTTRITSITNDGGNLIIIMFTSGATDSAAAFTLESSVGLPGGFSPDSESEITALGGGVFRAVSPNPGDDQRFYRIKY